MPTRVSRRRMCVQIGVWTNWPIACARAVRVIRAQISDAIGESDFHSSFTREEYHAVVRKAQEYVRAGDIFQVVPSQRLRPFRARPVDVYRALRALNPSPYMYFLDVGGTQVVGSSPEILARLRDGVVTVRPIAGTRPRCHAGTRQGA